MELYNNFDKLDNIFNNSTEFAYKFKNIVNLPNYEKIHPVKQKKVRDIVKKLLNDEIGKCITEIIIFGSSTTLHCNSFSDIDIMVLGDFEKFYPKVDLYEYGSIDLFGYNREYFLSQINSNLFYRNIWQKGVKIYEQLFASCEE